MRVFIFSSGSSADVVGFSSREDGNNLPETFRPWKLLSGREMEPGEELITVRGGSDVVLDAVGTDGFYVATGIRGAPVGSPLRVR
jgi:hypothetical protein